MYTCLCMFFFQQIYSSCKNIYNVIVTNNTIRHILEHLYVYTNIHTNMYLYIYEYDFIVNMLCRIKTNSNCIMKYTDCKHEYLIKKENSTNLILIKLPPSSGKIS